MIYVGIDAASDKHDIYLINEHGEVYGDVFTISNDIRGYKKLHEAISNFMESTNDFNVRIGIESTGHYSKNLLLYLVKQGFQVMLINPILTNMDIKATSVRKTKTDKKDAMAICMFLDRNRFNFKPYTLKSYHTEALKSLSRRRNSLVKELARDKIILNMLVTATFPEFKKVFSSLYINTALEILHKYSIPSNIAKVRIDGLTNLIYNASKGRHKRDTAQKIKTLATNTIGDSSDYYAIQIRLAVEKIRFLQSQIHTLEIEIKSLVELHYSNILTIPGMGYITAAMIIGEIGSISDFKSSDKLLAFAGLDPTVYQSGNYNANNTKMSKRGSKYLRWSIYQVASVIVHNDKTFNKYYQKKINQGKHHYVALGHVCKKVTRVIYSLLKYNKEFIPQS